MTHYWPFIIMCTLLGCGTKQPTIRFVHDVPTLVCDSPLVMQSSAGGLKQWCETTDGILSGAFVEYLPNLERIVGGTYKAGKRHGAWREWHPNGDEK